MPKKLDVVRSVTEEITDEEITQFAINLADGLIIVAFDEKNNSGSVVRKSSHVISGAEMQEAITRASTIAGADVYAAIKQALYEYLPGNGIIS